MSLGSLYEGLDMETKNIRQQEVASSIDVANSGWFHDDASRMKLMASQLQRTRLLKDQLHQSQVQSVIQEESTKQELIVHIPATPEDIFTDDKRQHEAISLSKDGHDASITLEPEIITNLSPMDIDFPVVENEYNPLKPNDYDTFARERSFKREIERLERIMRFEGERKRKKEESKKHSHKQRHRHKSSSSGSDDDSHRKSSTKNSSKSERAAIPPPASLADFNTAQPSEDNAFQTPGKLQKGLSVAANIMSKYGWKEGMGLGRASQGISTALSVEKTSRKGGKIINSTAAEGLKQLSSSEKSAHLMDMLKRPTKVILLQNMVGRGEVDTDLNEEVSEECRKYGNVVKTAIYEIPESEDVSDEEAVRIFIEFQRTECAIKAIVDLHGRFFAGRIVTASFYDEEKFLNMELHITDTNTTNTTPPLK